MKGERGSDIFLPMRTNLRKDEAKKGSICDDISHNLMRYQKEKEPMMTSVSQVEETLKTVMEERACVLARETGCIQRERAFNGADLLQMLVSGWLTHPDASLETLASTAAIRDG